MSQLFPKATAHGDVKQIFDDLFFVQGSVNMAPGMQISRNMIIVRHQEELTLISAVRLDDKGLKQLESLGTVRNVVRLGAYHLGHMNGLDDEFYLNRYNAKQWLLSGMDDIVETYAKDILSHDNLPFPNADLFIYSSSSMPEGLITIHQEGGVVISADSLQNWCEVDEFFSHQAGIIMKKAGFIQPANIGPEWRRANSPSQEDFQQVKNLTFQHLLPSHGKPLLNTAKQALSASIDRIYGIGGH